MRTPIETATIAASTWNTSFTTGRTGLRSSRSPTPKTMMTPSSAGAQPATSATLAHPSAVTTARLSTAASVTDTPPMRGIDSVWILRSLGRSSTPQRRPSTRPTLVAPMLPLPWRRMSTPRPRATR